MKNFTTRVELHDASFGDYERLHQYMHEEKFRRTIVGDNGISYRLPPAEYDSCGYISAEQVRGLAMKAAARTGRRFSVLTTEAAARAWYNCAEVVPAAPMLIALPLLR